MGIEPPKLSIPGLLMAKDNEWDVDSKQGQLLSSDSDFDMAMHTASKENNESPSKHLTRDLSKEIFTTFKKMLT